MLRALVAVGEPERAREAFKMLRPLLVGDRAALEAAVEAFAASEKPAVRRLGLEVLLSVELRK